MQETRHTKRLMGTFGAGSTHMVGDGFHVRNLFPSNPIGEGISPFLLLDYAGPTEFPPTDTPRGVGEHPHRGFETVTIVYQGRVAHRDSAGNAGTIGPGDVQWMTAASGVVHEELHEKEFAARGGTLEMVQLWVNLPRASKMSEPRYQEIVAADIPEVSLAGGAGTVRVIAGELADARGPARTFTPLNVWDVRLSGGHEATLDLPAGHNAALVVLSGKVIASDSPHREALHQQVNTLEDAQMALFAKDGERVVVRALEDSKLLVLSGEPLGEPVASQGPFVMNTRDEIVQAIRDFQGGRMGRLSGG